MGDLIETLQGLPLAEKESLFNALGDMILQETRVREMPFDTIKDFVCSLLGIDYNPASRERSQVIARTIIANALLVYGNNDVTVGRVMGKDRCTIRHYEDILHSWLQCSSTNLYRRELLLWNLVKESL